MARLLQSPATTAAAIEASAPPGASPDELLEIDEAEWHRRVHRPDAVQLTVRSVILGSVLGFFLSFSNVYIGLKTGWFLGVNLTACIVTYAVWESLHRLGHEAPAWPRWKKVVLLGPFLLGLVLRRLGVPASRMTILENTSAVSTASSAGYATGFMLISAVPAMLLLSVTDARPEGTPLPFGIVAAWVFFLALFGVTIAIPMKRAMINRERLRFPSGTAAAVTLAGLYSRGTEALAKARALFLTAGVTAFVPLLKDLEAWRDSAGERTTLLPGQSNVFDPLAHLLPGFWHRMANAGPPKLHPEGRLHLPSDYQMKLDHGVALAFAGILIGIRITGWMLASAVVLVLVVAPRALDASFTNAAGTIVYAATRPQTAWRDIGIWIGAPLLVTSGLVAFAAQWRTIGRAIAGLVPRRGGAVPDELAARVREAEVPVSWFLSGLAFSATGIVVLSRLYFEIPIAYGVLAVLMTFVLALVACRATGETDITPGGPLGKIMQLTYGVLIPQSSIANLQTAAITAGASHASADLLNDLKTGYLLGANPRRQVVAQALGIFAGTIASSLGYVLLVPNAIALTGTNTRAPAFPAVAAQQWKAVAEVFKLGIGSLHPMAGSAILWGGLVGAVLAGAEALAPPRYKRWIPSPTGIGLGFVLPFFYPLAMFAGALFATIATRVDKRWADKYLVPICAGGIAGESIVGVAVQSLNNFVLH